MFKQINCTTTAQMLRKAFQILKGFFLSFTIIMLIYLF
jgi:hypothetical protein